MVSTISTILLLLPTLGSSFLSHQTIPLEQHQYSTIPTPTVSISTTVTAHPSLAPTADSSEGRDDDDDEMAQSQRWTPSGAGGRRLSSERPRRQPPSSSISKSRNRTTNAPTERKRAPHQFDHTKAVARPFLNIDVGTFTKTQNPNEDAPLYIFPCDDIDDDDDEGTDPTTATDKLKRMIPLNNSHIQSTSLDNLFPNLDFSFHFNTNSTFRNALRNALREDMFDTTPSYANIKSEKARRMLLLPDSSLQGSWRCDSEFTTIDRMDVENRNEIGGMKPVRMKILTEVLASHLGHNAPTGDAFMTTIGNLCGSHPSTHWIDIVGIMDRKISYSWHQNTGRLQGNDSRTVLLGFPREDNYDGTGVFSHAVKLKYERHAPIDHPINEPIMYPNLVVEDEYVVKPRYALGREIIMFRDVHVLQSAPEVAYRASMMRFM